MAKLQIAVCLVLLGTFAAATSRMIGAGVAAGEAAFAGAFICASVVLFMSLTWAVVRLVLPPAGRAEPGAAADGGGR